MLTLSTLDVSTFNIEDPTLTWAFEPTYEALSGYNIDIYRSESPDDTGDTSSYDLIATGLSPNAYAYTDTSVSGLYHHNRTWYYKLLISGIGTSNVDFAPDDPAYSQDNTTDRAWIEILRRKSLVMNRTDGRYSTYNFYLLKRRTWGTHCDSCCWDDVLHRVTSASCTTCYGTGWNDGYFDPIPFNGMINASPKYNEITMFGEWMPSDALLVMLNFPPLKSKDIIIDSLSGERWVVMGQPRQVRKKNVVIEQRAQVALLQADDLLYSIEIET